MWHAKLDIFVPTPMCQSFTLCALYFTEEEKENGEKKLRYDVVSPALTPVNFYFYFFITIIFKSATTIHRALSSGCFPCSLS